MSIVGTVDAAVDCAVHCAVDSRGIASLTLNRPGRANAYDYPMLQSIARAFARLGADDRVRAIVLRATGKHFCAGADIASGSEPEHDDAPGVYEMLAAIEATPKPTIALVQGACVGGGVIFATGCDVVIAARTAFFSLPEVRLGLTPGPLGLLFARAVGLRSYRRYAVTGQRFDAEEACRMGLVHEVCDPDGMESALTAQLEHILLAAPTASRNAKTVAGRLAGAAPSADVIGSLQAEFMQLRESLEGREGAASFREKRKPVWYVA